MRNHVLVLVALAGLGLAGCGGGSAHHDKTSAAPTGGTAGNAAGPLPTGSPRGESDAATCTTISYQVTGAGVRITAQVATAPVKLNFEADDRDDNPVTGDPRTSGVDHTFTAARTPATLMIKGVRSLHHLTVIALNTGRDDSCRAYRR